MYCVCVMELQFEIPIECYQGRSCKFPAFKWFTSTVLAVLAVFLFLDCFVICDEVSMVSVPLGFEISGFDRTRTWVSQNGVFAFGFLEACQKDDGFDGFVAGVRYNLGDNVANVPVWTIGGGLRVPLNSTIRLSMDGRLILFENPKGLIVWSTNTSNSGVKKASLLNNGNLVLMDFGDNVLWESFDSPTSTLLPGQSLRFPQTLRSPSKKTISSYYSFVIRRRGELALVWENNVTYWRAPLSPSSDVEEVALGTDGVLRLVGSRNRTIWSAVSEDFDDPLVVLRRLRMDLDGNFRMYSWDHVLGKWKVGWQAVENQCDVFGSCGLYSLCGFNSTSTVCDCFYQDSTSFGSSFDLRDSGGFECKRMVDLGNCRINTSMIVLKQTVLYGLYPPLDVDMKLSEEECKDYCDSDSTCIATTSKNDGSGICTIKRTSFISGYRSPSIPATSFIKVCFVPLAVAAHGVDPHINAMKTPGSSEELGRKNNFAGTIVLILFVTIVGFLTMEIFVLWFFYRSQKFKAKLKVPFGKDAEMSARYSVLIRLSYDEIKELTSDFADQLGPSTFKGVISNEVPVIARVLNNVTVDERDFQVAVSTLGNIHHRHLVALKGFCFEEDHKFILYEYVQNGSLDNWLFAKDLDNQTGRHWQQRLEIALGIARGLAYLHSECQICIAHGNLKVENVLLDENLVPKLTDFGLRSLFLNETSTSSETPSERDIYKFGQMLLQLVTLKRDITSEDTHHLLDKICEELHTEDTVESGMERVVKIALWCMQIQPFLRPSIGEVVKVLEGTISVDRPPLGFGFRKDDGDEIVQHS